MTREEFEKTPFRKGMNVAVGVDSAARKLEAVDFKGYVRVTGYKGWIPVTNVKVLNNH